MEDRTLFSVSDLPYCMECVHETSEAHAQVECSLSFVEELYKLALILEASSLVTLQGKL